jgi:hypothetical protein
MSEPSNNFHINPFPGLPPFREDQDYLFFGRETQVDRMVEILANRHFLAVWAHLVVASHLLLIVVCSLPCIRG